MSDVCYKWFLNNNQETCFTDIVLTTKYYSDVKLVKRDCCQDSCYSILKRFDRSKQTGQIAAILTKHERYIRE